MLRRLLFAGNPDNSKKILTEDEKKEKLLNIQLSVFNDSRISNEPNRDDTYINGGIIHKCKAVAISILEENFSNMANYFGSSGYDGLIFDKARNLCLVKLADTLDDLHTLNPTSIYKICNLRMEFINLDSNSITVNAYGTLYGKHIENEKK
jgi:hypothetical protein